MNIAGLTQVDIAVYGIVAALLPGLIAIINRPTFPAWAKQLVMVVVAVAAGAVTYGLKNGWDFSSTAGVITALTGVWVATQAAYLVFWKQALAPAIESNVNGGPAAKAARDADIAPDYDATIVESFDEPVEELPVSAPLESGKSV